MITIIIIPAALISFMMCFIMYEFRPASYREDGHWYEWK